jgi:Ulp1 family protease
VNYLSFYHLLQYGQMTDDSIIQAFLQCLRISFPQTYFLNTNFHRELSQNGWASAFSIFFLHNGSSRYAKKTQSKPSINSDNIVIPIHIHGCHWVALARHIIGSRTFFLYAYDLNSASTFDTIKSIYTTSTTSTCFHPNDAFWIKCHSFTYHPHSNECGS